MASNFQHLINNLHATRAPSSLVLAEIHDFLQPLSANKLESAVRGADLSALPPFEANYVAAMVEHACAARRINPPHWLRSVEPLASPWFASSLKSLRLYLLTNSPAAFRRRNLFIDSTLGARV